MPSIIIYLKEGEIQRVEGVPEGWDILLNFGAGEELVALPIPVMNRIAEALEQIAGALQER